MRIAFVSYEYPPDTAKGGIATYVEQAANMLTQRGHTVEVFTASSTRSGCEGRDNLKVHRIRVNNRSNFSEAILPIFASCHEFEKFDVVEGPDYGAEASAITKRFPDLPLVLKLHTPSYILRSVGRISMTPAAKLRFTLGALRRGQWPQLPQPQLAYDYSLDTEYHHALRAQSIASPSIAIRDRIKTDWRLDDKAFSLVPYPYIPSPDILNIPLDTDTRRVTFIGRLEARKGILDLMKAVPMVLKQSSNVKFRFVGPPWPSPIKGLNMKEYMQKKLWRYSGAIEFTDAVPLRKIPTFLSETDVCVFPSVWESFGLVCLEAMAAGRGVVASSAGGMAELLDGGKAGLLIPPKDPVSIATSILKLLREPLLRRQYGAFARERVLLHYSLDCIGVLQEENYIHAIKQLPSSQMIPSQKYSVS